MSNTPRFGMPRIDAAQASQDVTHNTGLNLQDIFINLAIASVGTPSNTPPGSPADGDTYLVGAAGTGLFSGHNNAIAYYMQGWIFFTPIIGLVAYSKDTGIIWKYDGAAWTKAILASGGVLNLDNLGGTPATPTGGGVIYTQAGALKYKGSSGTVTTLAPA